MAAAVQGLPGDEQVNPAAEYNEHERPAAIRTKEGVHLFGIRHLSPAGAWHLKAFLSEIMPLAVLIEGPSDCSSLTGDIAYGGIEPPFSLLCYTTEVPVQSVMYPMAVYSPEYQAVLWAAKNNAECRFIDLPSRIKLPLSMAEEKTRRMLYSADAEGDKALAEKARAHRIFYEYENEIYSRTAELGGDEDHETFWERSFEHSFGKGEYQRAVSEYSSQIRDLTSSEERQADPLRHSINALRESYMKRSIKEVLDSGIPAEKIVVVTGSYHMAGLAACEPMTDEELSGLPSCETKMTLMPYSYYRLSSFSGYGAGNHAPYYYEMMWEAVSSSSMEDLPALYMAKLSAIMREKHGYSSAASVIEGVRLAKSLQIVRGGRYPALQDLHDSAAAVMAAGQYEDAVSAFAALDVGTRIGSLPEGVSQTPIQDDMNRCLKELRLEKYKSAVAQTLELDLRENIKTQSRKSSFLDLDRSVFLMRLAFLGIGFARQAELSSRQASWAERWDLCWTPETEIQLVESVLLGDTIEAAAAHLMQERLKESSSVLETAKLVRTACECSLTQSAADALGKLQSAAGEAENFMQTALAAWELSLLSQYGSLRSFDVKQLVPILQQLFYKSSLLLLPASSCDDAAARETADNIMLLHQISLEHGEAVNDEIWLRQLRLLAESDDKNPLLCGFAVSVLMERGQLSEEELSCEISRYLSPSGNPHTGAAWFEGLSMRNRYLLLSRPSLWRELDSYLCSLNEDEFKRALVCLRRSFSAFEAREKSGICEILAEIWGTDTGAAAELLQDTLSAAEEELLDELNDFDFGDLL